MTTSIPLDKLLGSAFIGIVLSTMCVDFLLLMIDIEHAILIVSMVYLAFKHTYTTCNTARMIVFGSSCL